MKKPSSDEALDLDLGDYGEYDDDHHPQVSSLQ